MLIFLTNTKLIIEKINSGKVRKKMRAFILLLAVCCVAAVPMASEEHKLVRRQFGFDILMNTLGIGKYKDLFLEIPGVAIDLGLINAQILFKPWLWSQGLLIAAEYPNDDASVEAAKADKQAFEIRVRATVAKLKALVNS